MIDTAVSYLSQFINIYYLITRASVDKKIKGKKEVQIMRHKNSEPANQDIRQCTRHMKSIYAPTGISLGEAYYKSQQEYLTCKPMFRCHMHVWGDGCISEQTFSFLNKLKTN